MKNLPSGTVTFLFTDIEGSTKLAQQFPDRWESLREKHHAILQTAMDAHNGYAFQIIGDAFCVAFHTAMDGLNSAIEAQKKIQTENWGETPVRVRMGLHTGPAELRDSDYHGYMTLARVQRVMSVAYGGQILSSNTSAELIHNELPEAITLRDMKEHRLKGLFNPERLWQIVAPDLQQDFPPLQSLTEIPNNLPVQLTTFIGREKELGQIKKRLEKNRLVTLTGSGGIGKTRLSIQVASELLNEYPNGAWLVELAPLANPVLVTQTVSAALDVPLQDNTPALNVLIDFLHAKKILLVVDNCEHLIDACAQLCEALLHACPNLRIIASSREALGIDGENAYRVPSLSLPAQNDGLQAIEQSEAVNLFVERATSALPEFKMTETNASTIAQICQRLDGIALAIELAAARVKILKVEQIAARLDNAFRLLTGGSRTALPRQQTLRALIDWSYNLLPDEERIILRYFSVFVGGWTLEAAESVCDRPNTLDLLTHLVDKSLVTVDLEHGNEPRYYLLETIRQYAREKLFESGEGEKLRTRHLDFFLRFAQEAEPKFRGPEQEQWFDRTDIEYENLRAALDWSINEGCVEKGMRLVSALEEFWDKRGDWHEGIEHIQRLLVQPEASARTLTRANTMLILVHFLMDLGESRSSQPYVEELITIAREHDDAGKPTLALGLGYAGHNLAYDDPVKAQVFIEEILTIIQSLDDLWIVANVLLEVAMFFYLHGDYVMALAKLEESLRLFKTMESTRLIVIVNHYIGRIKFLSGDYDGARLYFEQNLEYSRATKDRVGLRVTSRAMGELERKYGHYDAAKKYYMQTIELARELGQNHLDDPRNLGFVFLHEKDNEHARTLFVKSISLAQKQDEKITIALSLGGFGGLAALEAQAFKAVALFAASQRVLETMPDNVLDDVDKADLAYFLASAREQVDEVSFNTAWAKGSAMTMEQAISYALEKTQ